MSAEKKFNKSATVRIVKAFSDFLATELFSCFKRIETVVQMLRIVDLKRFVVHIHIMPCHKFSWQKSTGFGYYAIDTDGPASFTFPVISIGFNKSTLLEGNSFRIMTVIIVARTLFVQ